MNAHDLIEVHPHEHHNQDQDHNKIINESNEKENLIL